MNRNATITATAAALCTFVSSGVWAQEAFRQFEARKAGLTLELPSGWKLTELELGGGGEQRREVTLVRLSEPRTEPRLSQMAALEIYVHALPDGTPLQRWVEAEHPALAAREVSAREVRVAGVPGIARSVRFEGAEPMREVFLAAGGRGLHIAWPERPGLELTVQHALDTLAFSPVMEGAGLEVRADATGPRQSSAPYGIVRPVLLTPVDVRTRHDYRLVVTKAMQHLQLWFQAQVGAGMTFSLADIDSLNSAQTESWFANNPAGADPAIWFWRNALAEALGMVGGGFFDARNAWVIYVDADPNCGAPTGGASGVVVLPRNDLRGLTQQPLRRCPGDGADSSAVCRWVGGLGFRVGHAFGLPNPPGCDDADPATSCPDTLLWTGYATYPNTVLTPDEKARLAASPFFSALNLTRPLFNCTKLFAPPQ